MRGLIVVAFVTCLCWTAVGWAAPEGINIGWDVCGSPGLTNKDFACNTSSGSDVFVVSYVPPLFLHQPLIGIEAEVIMQPPGETPLPSWWHLESSGCRPSSLTLSYLRGADTLCAEYSSGPQINWWGYALGYDSPNSASLLVSVGAGPPGVWVTQGLEYFGFRIILDHAKSTGADSCGGCSSHLTMVLDRIGFVYETGKIVLTNPLRQNIITWQGGIVPVRNVTWGQIKGLYR
jgi:hypothetical protein